MWVTHCSHIHMTSISLVYTPQSMGYELHTDSVFISSVESVQAVHRVYMSMQDLFNQFQSVILPEAINHVLMEDEGMLEILEELSTFKLTSYPNLSLMEALSRLAEDLLQAGLKVRKTEQQIFFKFVNLFLSFFTLSHVLSCGEVFCLCRGSRPT